MENQRDKIRVKTKIKKAKKSERYLLLALKSFGLLFLIIAGYYFFNSLQSDFFSTLVGFLTASDATIIGPGAAVFPWKPFSYLLISHIIGLSGLIWAIYYSKKHPNKAYRIILSIIIAMTFFNTIIYIYWFFTIWALPYYNYYIASVFLVVTLILFFISYLLYKKQALLIAILIYFYVFMFEMLMDSLNENRYLYVLSAISIFSVLLFFISRRDKPFLSLFMNGVFAYGFLMILVLKKFVFNINATYLSWFFTISFLYFVIFYATSLYFSIKEKKKVFLVFNVINTIVYISLNGYVLSIFGNLNYLILIVFISLVIHILSIIGCNKFNFSETRLTTIETISLVLISATLSLNFSDYYFSLFFGIISMLLFLYAKQCKVRGFVKFCMISIILLILNFIYLSINNYFSLLNSSVNSQSGIFQNIFINSGIILFFLFFVRKIVMNSKQDGVQNWFNRRKYIRFLDIALTITLFISIEWFTFSILYSTTYDIVFLNRILLLVGGFFTLFIIKNEDYFSKSFKNWIYFPIYFFSILLISQIYINFSFSSIDYIFTKNLILIEVVLHYVELFLAAAVFFISFTKLYLLNNKKRKNLIRFIIFTSCLLSTIIVCKEFDYISILTSDLGSGTLAEDKFQMILKLNGFLPYSMIILFCFSIVLIIGIKYKSLFLKILSLVFIVADLIKIFFLEFSDISDNNKAFVFIVIGVLLLLVSWFYNKIKQKSRQRILRQ
jgi:hypothetical protein